MASKDFQDRSHLLTEQRLAESMELDRMSVEEALAMMNAQDAIAVNAVAAERGAIARAVGMVSKGLGCGGRLIYVGAGTSGRLGVLDASECPPTFGVEAQMVQGIIAGGEAAMFRSQEGAEDQPEDGAAAIDTKNVSAKDVVMGIAAGGTTPFVHGALERAKSRGAGTIFLCCVQATAGEPVVDVMIRPLVGPEVLTGSTRLKAGTATKLVLNQITTLAMVQLGKVFENLMVDLRASNVKLWDRGARIVGVVTGLERDAALKLLQEAGGEVKTAIVMHWRGVGAQQSRAILRGNGGKLRAMMGGGQRISTRGSSVGTNG
jgi:N-acetylmuramic acid 6-phosphate etherase